jgi:hypothetical protein
MVIKKQIGISKYNYLTKPKMGTSNIMYGAILGDPKKTKSKLQKKKKSNDKKRS